MMRALLHRNPKTFEIVGVWFIPTGKQFPAAVYGHDQNQLCWEEMYATSVMLAKQDHVDWDTFWLALDERVPVTAWWDYVELPDAAEEALLEINRLLGRVG